MERSIELSHLWYRVWTYRRPVLALVLTATLVTGVVAFLLPPWYQATGSLLPPGQQETGFGLSRFIRGGVTGLELPTESTPAEVFIATLESRRINEEIIQRFGLMKRYKKKYMEDTVKELRRHTKFKLTDAGTIEMTAEDTDPKIAAAMINAYIDLLDRFNRDVRMTKGRRTRMFVEKRLLETKQELASAEQRLTQYQSQHKAVALTPELTTAIENAARLYGQRTALEVRLGLVRSYSRGRSDEEQQIMDQLAQLDRQLQALPETGLDLARLVRDVKTFEQVYVLLTAQYEEARVDEARDVTTVEVLDAAKVPERKIRPKRGVLILTSLVLSLAVGVAYALFQPEVKPQAVRSTAAMV